MASRKSRNIHVYTETFYGGQKLYTYFCTLRVIGMSLLTCSYVGELRNGQKLKCENELFTVFI